MLPEPHHTTVNDIDYTVKEGALHVFGHTLDPKYRIKLADSADDEDVSSISFPRSDDGRRIVIVHTRDDISSEFWLYDRITGRTPARIAVESGRAR